MFAIDTLLFGLVAGLIGFKTALLAAAAILFLYTMTGRTRQRKMASARVAVRTPRLDVHA